ncbi:hypothetical protein [Thalassospira marina]|uniref:Uncharacterized protein n=1 Tax=Thalassospira marina TaxID=2048283 RepID=A0A2N3KUQ3_9PROT|nr:hypothetical protein [Thalassospira marina]PKR54236.1 hypothetical protein COO20_08800 [Thalassospira marina]
MNREQLLKPLKPIGIEGLVNWAFGVQWIGRKEAVNGETRDGLAAERRMMQRLTASYCERIPGSGAAPVSNDERHPQAMALYRAWLLLREASGDAAEIVRSWGEVCGRPDWYPDGVERFVAVLDAQGHPVPARDHNRNLAKASCKVERVGHSEPVVSMARAEYLIWWQALSVLQLDMREFADKSPADCLYRITGEMPPQTPWLAVGEKKASSGEKAA